MKRHVLVIVLVLAFSLVVADVALAADGEGGDATAGEVALALAPLVAAATAIERFMEMVFDWYESLVLSASNLLGQGKGYVAWAKEQLKAWEDEWDKLRKAPTGSKKASEFKKAEEALADAQDRLAESLKAPAYTSRKRVISLAVGIVLGVIVAFTTKLQMLAIVADLFGVTIDTATGTATGPFSFLLEAGKTIDRVLTGLIIGTGSAPVHSLIGILQNTKDAVDKAREQFAGRALQASDQWTELLRKPDDVVYVADAMALDVVTAEKDELSGLELERRIKRMLR